MGEQFVFKLHVLDKIYNRAPGFKYFNYIIGPTGPGDSHPYWIYVNAIKTDQ